MIVGIGIDVAEIDRLERLWERYGLKIAQKILHPLELEVMPKSPAAFLASRFAAKEAAVKALGTGFSEGISQHDIYVKSLPSGKPEIFFINAALERFKLLGADAALLSLSHGKNIAAAVVVIEKLQME